MDIDDEVFEKKEEDLSLEEAGELQEIVDEAEELRQEL